MRRDPPNIASSIRGSGRCKLKENHVEPALTLGEVASEPDHVTTVIQLSCGAEALLRPLVTDDDARLAEFLTDLSPSTRQFSTFSSYDITAARDMCHAINRYDKLRLVVELVTEQPGQLIALFEFSFDVPAGDRQRFRNYGLDLDTRTDCRFGPTIADAYQNQGLGRNIFSQ